MGNFLVCLRENACSSPFHLGKGEAQDAYNELVELQGAGPGELVGCGWAVSFHYEADQTTPWPRVRDHL